MEIREFSKRRIKEKASSGDDMVKIFHGCVKMEEEEERATSQKIRSRKNRLPRVKDRAKRGERDLEIMSKILDDRVATSRSEGP